MTIEALSFRAADRITALAKRGESLTAVFLANPRTQRLCVIFSPLLIYLCLFSI